MQGYRPNEEVLEGILVAEEIRRGQSGDGVGCGPRGFQRLSGALAVGLAFNRTCDQTHDLGGTFLESDVFKAAVDLRPLTSLRAAESSGVLVECLMQQSDEHYRM